MKFIKKFSSIEEYEAAELSYPATSLVSGTVIYDKELTPQYRTLTTATTCINYDKYVLEEYQVSMDRGKTWTTTGTSATTLIEADSEDCGYVPPVSAPKWLATYSDSHTESAECGSSSEITNGEISKTGLTSVEIGDCVTRINNYAFSGYSSLTSITISDSITNIGTGAFQDCSGLTSVTIPNSVTTINDRVFQYCSGLTNVTIGSGVTSIVYEAFSYCTSLTGITIPNTITSIGGNVFNGCSSLTSVTVEATTPPYLGSGVFNSTNNCPIYVPEESVQAYKTAEKWSVYASRIQAIP